MEATKTVAQRRRLRKSTMPEILAAQPHLALKPKHGVITLFGYGIQIRVDRGHLIIEDGIGANRRYARLARINHQLERLVVIGSDGMVTLSALRWLADQKAAFVMLERDGSVLAAIGPVRNADARLRRAQACAGPSMLGLEISRQLIILKLDGQERVARIKLQNSTAADQIAAFRDQLPASKSIDDVRQLEAKAASIYWVAWRELQMQFPKPDLCKIPEHWRRFGSRQSPLSGSPRRAVNPMNAILNYCYSILEAETRIAIATMGLDPGMGFLHADYELRDSLACDLMEVVRPDVDGFLFDWISSRAFKRDWFFEDRNGHCRLMGEFAATLSETAQTYRRAVAPIVEWLARTLWEHSPQMAGHRPPSSRLTQSTKRAAQGSAPCLSPPRMPARQNFCRTCGSPIKHYKGIYCRLCNAEASKNHFASIGATARKLSHSGDAQAKRAETLRRSALAQHGWVAAEHPKWLDQNAYVNRILPRLSGLTATAIESAIQVSVGYADSIRKGRVHPHARHWQTLANLVGVLPNSKTPRD